MTLGQSYADMPQTTATPAVLCQGRVLTAEEVLGLRGQPAPRRALPLVLSGWIGLIIVAADPFAALFTLFAAPLVLTLMQARSRS